MEKNEKKFNAVETIVTAVATVGGSIVAGKLLNSQYLSTNNKVEGPIELIGYIGLAIAGGIAAGRAANGTVKAIEQVTGKVAGTEETEETDKMETEAETETVVTEEVEA